MLYVEERNPSDVIYIQVFLISFFVGFLILFGLKTDMVFFRFLFGAIFKLGFGFGFIYSLWDFRMGNKIWF